MWPLTAPSRDTCPLVLSPVMTPLATCTVQCQVMMQCPELTPVQEPSSFTDGPGAGAGREGLLGAEGLMM